MSVNKAALNRAEILSALDHEIGVLEKEHSRPGWSRWTFYAGIGSLLWLASTEVTKPPFTPINAAALFVLFSIAMDCIEVCVACLKPTVTSANSASRFRLFNQVLAGSRIQLAGGVVRCAAILAAYIYAFPITVNLCSIVFFLMYGTIVVGGIGAIVVSHFSFPTRHEKAGPRWRVKFILLTVFVLSLFGIAELVNARKQEFSVTDTHMGMLLAAFFWLICLWASHVSQDYPLLDSLRTLRRDLAFGRIPEDTALSQAEIAIEGMKLDDYLHDDLKTVLGCADETGKSIQELTQRTNEAISLVESWIAQRPTTPNAPIEPKQLLRAVLEACNAKHEQMVTSVTKLREGVMHFSKRKEQIKYLANDSEILGISNRVKRLAEKLTGEAVQMDERRKCLADKLVQLGNIAPELVFVAPARAAPKQIPNLKLPSPLGD